MKSYVTLEQKICKVCGKTFDTGDLLLDRTLRDRFDTHTVTGFDLCKEDRQRVKDGFVALVGIDASKSKFKSEHEVAPDNVYRTGEIAYVKRDVYEQIFKEPLKDGHQMVFCDPNVITALAKMAEAAEGPES